jgi:hypothetical protein
MDGGSALAMHGGPSAPVVHRTAEVPPAPAAFNWRPVLVGVLTAIAAFVLIYAT